MNRAIRDYASLTKPRINALLLLTTLAGMVIAARGWPGTRLVILTLSGGGLTAAGAATLNCWFDRDLDRAMLRTRARPLPAGRIEPSHAFAFAILLVIAGLALLAGWVNGLSALLAAVGFVYYALVYTAWLKRTTPMNTVIGGGAGAVPPLVGWAASSGRLTLAAFSLAGIIFLWTPPHFWALALRLRGDYMRARLPMLPAVAGVTTTGKRIVAYTLALLGVTLIPFFTGTAGRLYLFFAAALGGTFVALALANLHESRRWIRPLFDYSVVYLALLFTAMALDSVA